VVNATPKGALIINMGSVEPAVDLKIAQLVTSQNKLFLDAPVSGGVQGAEAGTLTIFVGGSPADLAYAQPAFDAMGRANLLGPHGAGQTAKLANQLIVGITIGAVAEAFKLAESAGCDAKKLRTALMGGFADSKILQIHGQRMVEENYTPGAHATTQLKDLQQAQLLAEQSEIKLPLNQACLSQWQAMVDAGLGHLDQAGILAWVDRNN
jgi:2-hydroxy-3-oxopropionate reductase